MDTNDKSGATPQPGQAEQRCQRKGLFFIVGQRQQPVTPLFPGQYPPGTVKLLPQPGCLEQPVRFGCRRPCLCAASRGAQLSPQKRAQRCRHLTGKPPPDTVLRLQDPKPQFPLVPHDPGAPDPLSRQAAAGGKPGVQRFLLHRQLPQGSAFPQQRKLVHVSAPFAKKHPACATVCTGGMFDTLFRPRYSSPAPVVWW